MARSCKKDASSFLDRLISDEGTDSVLRQCCEAAKRVRSTRSADYRAKILDRVDIASGLGENGRALLELLLLGGETPLRFQDAECNEKVRRGEVTA